MGVRLELKRGMLHATKHGDGGRSGLMSLSTPDLRDDSALVSQIHRHESLAMRFAFPDKG